MEEADTEGEEGGLLGMLAPGLCDKELQWVLTFMLTLRPPTCSH
jgi:hypothetical protein